MGMEIARPGELLLRNFDRYIDVPHQQRVDRYTSLRSRRSAFTLNQEKKARGEEIDKEVEPFTGKDEVELALHQAYLVHFNNANEAHWRRCDVVQEAVELVPVITLDSTPIGQIIGQQTLKLEEVIDATDSGPGAQSTQGVLVGV